MYITICNRFSQAKPQQLHCVQPNQRGGLAASLLPPQPLPHGDGNDDDDNDDNNDDDDHNNDDDAGGGDGESGEDGFGQRPWGPGTPGCSRCPEKRRRWEKQPVVDD